MPPSLTQPNTASARTTRRTRSIHVPDTTAKHLLVPDQVIASPETGLRYRIDRQVGKGGFGEAYLAARLGRSTAVPATVCIKVSDSIDGWVREAYFGKLLGGHPRAIRLFDMFPLMRPDGRVLYYLALEYACHGDLAAFLEQDGKRWTEAAARREIAGILQVLGKLHRGQLLHRDLTPMNVFVCEGRTLKLGDFGIVRQQSDGRGITVRTMTALTAPSEIIAGAAPKWQARDDVFQVGQLLAMVVRGNARERVRPQDVRGLACSDQLKEIVYRCIGERRKRYESADELIAALADAAGDVEARRIAIAQGRAPGVHGHPVAAARRRHRRGAPRRRRRARQPVHAHDRGGARPAQRPAGGWPGRGDQADGDQAPARTRPSHHAVERSPVLAPGRRAPDAARPCFSRAITSLSVVRGSRV